MKQHITKEQWGEITGDQRVKLISAMLNPFHAGITEKEVKGGERFMLIGELIDFLQKDHAVKIDQWMDKWRHWRVGLDWLNGDSYEYVCEQEELVDALWMAVKYKLNN